tara:strand:- start:690 stop:827 length:138 start_codon:yes stop_codon:yes gene_type:complete
VSRIATANLGKLLPETGSVYCHTESEPAGLSRFETLGTSIALVSL